MLRSRSEGTPMHRKKARKKNPVGGPETDAYIKDDRNWTRSSQTKPENFVAHRDNENRSPEMLGGKHRRSSTGLRHVSKVADNYLQMFADDYESYEPKQSPLDKWLSEMKPCDCCSRMVHPANAAIDTEESGRSWIWCPECWASTKEPAPPQPDCQVFLF